MTKALVIILTLATIGTCILGINLHNKEVARYDDWVANREVITVYISSGDTLDGYYVEYAPDWMDRYTYRAAILELNGMHDCTIYAGDYIKLYVVGDH